MITLERNPGYTEQQFAELSELKQREVNGRIWGYFEDGDPDADIVVLNLSGWNSGSGLGNRRLSKNLAGQLENSIQLQDYKRRLPKAAEFIKDRIESFDGKYRVFTPQLPGGGFTPPLENPTLDNMADEIIAFADAVGLKKFVIFGSSMGGILAIKVAARLKERVTGVALQGVMTKMSDLSLPLIITRYIVTNPIVENLIENHAESVYKGLLTSSSKEDIDNKYSDEHGRKQMDTDARLVEIHTSLKNLEGIGRNLQQEIDMIESPVLFMDGEKADKTVSNRRIARRFHKNQKPLRKKIDQGKVWIGQISGDNSHSVLNSGSDIMALYFNHWINFVLARRMLLSENF